MEPFGAAASIIAVLELCVKVTGYISSAKDARKERSRLRADILAFKELLKGPQVETKDGDDAKSRSTTIEALKDVKGPLRILHETLSLLVAKLKPTIVWWQL